MAEQKHDTHAADPHGGKPADQFGHGDTYTEVAAGHGDDHGDGHGSSGPISLDANMFLLFLLVFFVAGVILRKYAWNPILAALDEREKNISDSIANAEKIAEEMQNLDAKVEERIAEADAKAKDVLDHAKNGARDAARKIEHDAREEAKILLENARREISTAEDKAIANLRQESAAMAVSLAGKILQSELDEAKSRELTDKLIADL